MNIIKITQYLNLSLLNDLMFYDDQVWRHGYGEARQSWRERKVNDIGWSERGCEE